MLRDLRWNTATQGCREYPVRLWEWPGQPEGISVRSSRKEEAIVAPTPADLLQDQRIFKAISTRGAVCNDLNVHRRNASLDCRGQGQRYGWGSVEVRVRHSEGVRTALDSDQKSQKDNWGSVLPLVVVRRVGICGDGAVSSRLMDSKTTHCAHISGIGSRREKKASRRYMLPKALLQARVNALSPIRKIPGLTDSNERVVDECVNAAVPKQVPGIPRGRNIGLSIESWDSQLVSSWGVFLGVVHQFRYKHIFTGVSNQHRG